MYIASHPHGKHVQTFQPAHRPIQAQYALLAFGEDVSLFGISPVTRPTLAFQVPLERKGFVHRSQQATMTALARRIRAPTASDPTLRQLWLSQGCSALRRDRLNGTIGRTSCRTVVRDSLDEGDCIVCRNLDTMLHSAKIRFVHLPRTCSP